MNHVYRVVFNRILGVWQAVTELAKSQGKIGGAIKRHARKLAALAAIASGAAGTNAAAQPAPNQLPQGGQVAAGNISIQQSGAQMQINQSTQKGIINWQQFDVGSNASVHFNQPNANAATLNRVNSANASQIYGQISAVGKVFLLNSNGVVFGPSARVNVGALVAGAMKITDEDFLAGNYKFTEGKGVITNMGELTAEEGGLIALLAPQVINEGVIRAKKGAIVLAAGEAITLTNLASNVTVIVEKPALDALIKNKHLVSAPDGRVFMSTRAAHQLARAVISNTGTIEATGARRVGDVIRLEGNTIINAGVVDASNTNTTDANSPNPDSPQGSDITVAATKDVTNTGTIRSNGGSGAAGGSGGKITIAAQETITNQGTIEAKGGVGSSVNVTDTTTASKGGEIALTANDIVNEGEINVSGQIGGQVTLDAQNTVVNQGEINASGQIGGQVTITAAEITQALDAGITVQSVAQGLDESAALPVEILLEMADYVPPQITIEASHNVQLTGKLDVSSLNHDGGTLTIKADSTQLIDIELTAASTVTTGGLIEIESNMTYVDNALIDVSGTVKAGQVFMTAPQPEVPAMPTAPPEPVPVPVPNPSSLIVQYSTITATSRKGQGGNITLTADTIDLSHTQIIATGDKVNETAGGTIKVGGDWQGQGSLPQATTVTIDEHSTLDVSAITNGNAGMIVAWSDIHNPNSRTIVNGTLLAKGGSESGDGGMIETSGYDLKVDGITVSTQATNGTTGQWLLDPRNITITSSGDTVDTSSGVYNAAGDDATIDVATLVTALGTTNVTVFTGTTGTQAGNITVDAAISSGSIYDLELKAANDIIINQNITRSDTGGLILRAGSGSVSGTGDLILGGGTTLSLAHGTTLANDIQLTGGATIAFADLEVEYLIVGGGGAGGSSTGGGGGGGGLLQGSGYFLGGPSYSIAVGAGGTANSGTGAGGKGGNSSAFGLTAIGGGGGGSNQAGHTGGSGGSGGGSSHAGSGGSGTSEQGFAGGSSKTGFPNYPSGGGGGAGEAGQKPENSSSNGGKGGDGLQSSITGTAIWYAGGGGGGVYNQGSGGAGGLGGGGKGGDGFSSNETSGTNGLGGGGGGSSRNSSGAGAGGSGVVVVRYVSSTVLASGGSVTSFDGTGTIGESGVKYQVHSFTTVGSSTFEIDNLAATITGSISGPSALTLDASKGTITLSGASTSVGNTNIVGGKVALTNAAQTPADNLLTVNVGALSGNGNLALDEHTKLVTSANSASSFGGKISGLGALEKAGSGTLKLRGNNTYSGGTTVTAGTVSLLSSKALGTGNVTMADGTAMQLSHGLNVANDFDLTGTVNFSLAQDLLIDYLIVGGGAGGGANSGSGGDGGQVFEGFAFVNGSEPVAAGTASPGSSTNGSGALPAGASSFLGIQTTQATGGASGGGEGGDGAGGPAIGTSGGSGYLSSITGTALYYGSGGDSGTGQAGADGLGQGGAGGGSNAAGADGGTGVVIVRYLGENTASGGNTSTVVIDGDVYTVHTFQEEGVQNFFDFDVQDNFAAHLSGNISGSGKASIDADRGKITLSGATSDYTGGTDLTKGTLIVRSSSALGDDTAANSRLQMDNNTKLLLGHNVSIANNITLAGTATIGLAPLEVEYLIVGGGGGGGGSSYLNKGVAGGGGAGGEVLTGTAVVGTSTPSVSVAVGAGGLSGQAYRLPTSGALSSFGDVQADGGGRGAGRWVPNSTQIYGQLLGGGARNVGGDGAGQTNPNNGGTGGAGISSSISGTSATFGTGGNAGPAGTADTGISASPNTGAGGGGAGGTSNTWPSGGDGGSGIVVIRYLGDQAAIGGDTASGTGTADGYTVHRFTDVGNSTFELDLSAAISGDISGSNALTLDSKLGTITLEGANSFNGNTTITGGTVKVTGTLGHATDAVAPSTPATGDFTSTITNAGKLIVNSSAIQTFSAVISGAGSFEQAGSGKTIFTADNTYTGVTTISDGTLQLGNDTSAGMVLSTSLVNDGTLIFKRTDDLTAPFTISGSGNVEQDADSKLTFTSNNTYTGTTTISDGDLQVGDNSAAGSVGTGDISIADGSSLIVDRTNDYSLTQDISGLGKLVKQQNTTLSLWGSNSYEGGTDLDAGTIIARTNSALGNSTHSTLTMAVSTTLLLGHNVSIANAISLAGAATIGMAPLEVEYLLVAVAVPAV